MEYHNLNKYVYKDFQAPLEKIPGTHYHVARRESEVIYRDEYALSILNHEYPLIYDQSLKDWARSYYTLEGHMQAIFQYATEDTQLTSLNQTVYTDAVQAIKNELRSLPIAEAFDVLSDLDKVHYEQASSAGYDYIGVKGPILGENHKRAIHRARATLWSAIRDSDGGPKYVIEQSVPDIGYTRTQLADLTEKIKVRGVWGRAFHYILLEGTSARPLLDQFSTSKTFFHIGEDPILSVPRVLSEVSRQCKWLYAIDWSSFDATASTFEINAAFDLIKERVLFPNYETEQAFEVSRQLFIHKKIAAPDGFTYWSHKGIPSGSYFTSIIGSIINRLRIEYLWRLITGQAPQICYTHGDDSLIGDNTLIKPETIAQAAYPLGWIINPNKTEYSTSPEFVTFLGRTTKGGLNSREIDRALRLLIFPEYPVETGDISAYRATSIAQDCGNMSDIINTIARKLRRTYGIAPKEKIPKHFLRYIP